MKTHNISILDPFFPLSLLLSTLNKSNTSKLYKNSKKNKQKKNSVIFQLINKLNGFVKKHIFTRYIFLIYQYQMMLMIHAMHFAFLYKSFFDLHNLKNIQKLAFDSLY